MSRAAHLLADEGLVAPEVLPRLQDHASRSGATLLEQLVLSGTIDERLLCDLLSRRYSLPCASDGDLMSAESAAVDRLTRDIALECRAMPLRCDADGYLLIAMEDPGDEAAIAELEFFCGGQLLRHVAAPSALGRALRRFYGVRTPFGRTSEIAAANTNVDGPRAAPIAPQVLATAPPAATPVTGDLQAAPPAPPLGGLLAVTRAELERAASLTELVEVMVQCLADAAGCATYVALREGALHAEEARLPVQAAPFLAQVVARRVPHAGVLPDPLSQAFLLEALRREVTDVVLLPLVARDTLLGLVCAPRAGELCSEAMPAALHEAMAIAVARITGR